MDDAVNSQTFLLVSHDAVIQFAVHLPLIRLSERALEENHVFVLGHLEPVGPTEARRVRRVQRQEPSQSVQREAAVAAAVAVAVNEQQVAAARGQVAVEGAALEEVEPLSQPQHTDGIALQESFVDGQSQSDGGRAPESLGKLQDLLCCTS